MSAADERAQEASARALDDERVKRSVARIRADLRRADRRLKDMQDSDLTGSGDARGLQGMVQHVVLELADELATLEHVVRREAGRRERGA